jgi:hypothetical protein
MGHGAANVLRPKGDRNISVPFRFERICEVLDRRLGTIEDAPH